MTRRRLRQRPRKPVPDPCRRCSVVSSARWVFRFCFRLVIGALCFGCSSRGTDANRVEHVIGKRGQLPGNFVKPRAIAIDADNRLYVVDMRAEIQVFDDQGQFLTGWRTPTHEFGRPSGLAIDREGNLLVADSHYHRILVYDGQGNLLRTLGGDEGEQPLVGRFGYIGDIAVDSQGNIFVAESQTNERITKLTSDGRILKDWGGRGSEPGQFQRIRALAVDRSDRIYAADACNHRIQVFDRDGKLMRIIGEPGSAPGQVSYPYDVAIAPDGTLIVCEYGNHRIQRFHPQGHSLGTWGKAGRKIGELWNPWAVAVDERNRVYVVDSNNHRIQQITF